MQSANNALVHLTPWHSGAPPSDIELMSAMMQRVTLLEKTVRSQAQEIERKVSVHLHHNEQKKLVTDFSNMSSDFKFSSAGWKDFSFGGQTEATERIR